MLHICLAGWRGSGWLLLFCYNAHLLVCGAHCMAVSLVYTQGSSVDLNLAVKRKTPAAVAKKGEMS